MAALFAAATLLVAVPTPNVNSRPGCPKTFTVPMVERAIDAIYRGTRKVSARDRMHLRRYVRCSRDLAKEPMLHRRWNRAWRAWKERRRFTGYVVAGTVSTFGPPLDGAGGTADGGSDARPCIALRDTSTLGRMFLVTIVGHSEVLLHCDSGPYANGRSIDVTGAGAYAMGLSPYSFPTDAFGTARMLR